MGKKVKKFVNKQTGRGPGKPPNATKKTGKVVASTGKR